MSLPVSEVFTSIQGEGPRAGRVVTFIRLGGCNLSCSWCDTPYTWDASRFNLRDELTPMPMDYVLAQIPGNVEEVIITGGEPLIHQETDDWAALLRGLARSNRFICVETNGTIVPNVVTETFVRHYSISPKLANAGEHKRSQNAKMAQWPPGIIHQRTAAACLKFVCASDLDVRIAADMATDYGWPLSNVWVMPLGTTEDDLRKVWPTIVKAAIDQRVNVTHRLHVLAFGDTRGT